MNEQLQQALAAALTKAGNGLEAGMSFLQAEIPEVVYQLLMWKLVYSLIQFTFALVAVGVAIAVGREVYRWFFVGEYYLASVRENTTRAAWFNAGPLDSDYAEIKNNYQNARAAKESLEAECASRTVVAFIAALIAVVGVPLCANLTWLKIWLAPKVYLIEYAAALVK